MQFPNLSVQPGSYCESHIRHYKSLIIFSKMSVSHEKNVCKSQNSMKPFFLYFQLINKLFLLVPQTVPVIMDNPCNFQDFLSFLMCIYTLFKRVYEVSEFGDCKSQYSVLVTKKIIF